MGYSSLRRVMSRGTVAESTAALVLFGIVLVLSVLAVAFAV
jgi:hypothetical protein